MVRLLSHPLGPSSPYFADTGGASFEPAERIANGDPSNWSRFTTQNHVSTHVDGPWHFNPEGKRITELDPAEFFFTSPRLLDLAKADDELITADDLKPHAQRIAAADLLLIRTGWGARYRDRDRERFRLRGPGFHPSAGHELCTHPLLRAVAMDFISAACPRHLEEGFEFHRVMLGRRAEDRYILLVEDARIDPDLTDDDLGRVIMAPWLLEDLDSAPVTMLAEARKGGGG